MNIQNIKSRLKAFIASLLSYRASPLPTTPQELESFTDDILTLGGWDLGNISFRNSVYTQILHIDIRETKAPKAQFVNAIKRSITNQLAYQRMQDVKNEAKQAANQEVV
jgi:hypothetical protein